MKSQIHKRYDSHLPDGDDHPYRSGAWRPQTTEFDAWDLDVEGTIPDDLEGCYLRNTENPRLPPIERYHPFDGDGMLHSISFGGGEAQYRNRFILTDGFLAEANASRHLYAGVGENANSARAECRVGARPNMKDASSTDVVVHGGKALTSFWLCGDLYQLDPWTLAPDGKATFGGSFPRQGVSAHPKIDAGTGEMLFFNYGTDAPFMHYGVVDARGELVHYIDVPLPGHRLPHDMAFTENYAIVNDLPMFWDDAAISAGVYAPRYHRDMPARFGLIPRRGQTEDIRWFEASSTYVLHFTNAYEDGDEVILDGYFQDNPSPKADRSKGPEHNFFRHLDLHAMGARLHRWRFNLVTGETREQRASDTVQEFGMINPQHAGRAYRYVYSALPCQGWFAFRGLIKHDLETGAEERVELPDGVFASETVMAPRVGSQREDDGYLITFTTDVERDRSECLILDAAHPTLEPVARIALPERIASGTHAFWHPGPPRWTR